MLISANAAWQHAEGLHIGGKHFVGEYNMLAYKSNAKNTRCQIPNAKKYMKPKKYSLDGKNKVNCIWSIMSVFVKSAYRGKCRMTAEYVSTVSDSDFK